MKRPWYISLFCIAGWFWLFVIFPSVFSPETKKIHLLLPTIYGIIIAFLFISFVGVWYMKRWGLELFFMFIFLKNFLDNFSNIFKKTSENISFNLSVGFIFFFIYGIVIAFISYRKMQDEL